MGDSRRFRFIRKVRPPKTRPDPTTAAPAEEDDAHRGTPEMIREVDKGCSGCLRVTLLVIAIMFASIIGTCAFIRK